MKTILIVFFSFAIFEAFGQEMPIRASRTIVLETQEVAYGNLDISADGKKLVFDLLGEIFVMPINGGEPKQLTRGLAVNANPIWSPDGNNIGYLSDRYGKIGLAVCDSKGNNVTHIGTEPNIKFETKFKWNTDSKSLISELGTEFFVKGIQKENTQLKQEIEKYKKMLPPRSTGIVVSPDSSTICYITKKNGHRLILKELSTGSERTLVEALSKESSTPSNVGRYVFSPNSEKIYIIYAGNIHCIDLETGADNSIPLKVKINFDLGPLNENHYALQKKDSLEIRYTRSASMRVDGRQMVFTALGKIFVKDLPQGKPQVLINQEFGQYQPTYSPDGNWIAYVSWSDSIGGALWCIPAIGGVPEKLSVLKGQYQRPCWSPDGKSLAFLYSENQLGGRDDQGKARLQLLDLSNASFTTIDPQVPLWNKVYFSKFGDSIYYRPKVATFYADTINQLVGKKLNKPNYQVIAQSQSGSAASQLLQLQRSPNGKFIVFTAAEDIYLYETKRSGVPNMVYRDDIPLPLIRIAAGIDPVWENDGKTLAWLYGNKYYRIDPERVLKQAEGLEYAHGNTFKDLKIVPDETIDLGVPAPVAQSNESLALINARLVTMEKKGVIENGTILIHNGRITKVGEKIKLPLGTKILDLKGKTVIPGLIDLHAHMGFTPDIFPQQSWMLLVNLAYGVTTSRDPSSSFDSYGYKELLESGKMIGPRLLTVGRAARFSDGVLSINSLQDARELVAKRKVMGSIVVKQYTLSNRLQRQWLLQACREAGMNMTNEIDQGYYGMLGMIKDGSSGIEHNPDWSMLGGSTRDLEAIFAKSGTVLTPALQVVNGAAPANEYFNYHYWRTADEKLKRFTLSNPEVKTRPINLAAPLEIIVSANPKDSLEADFLRSSKVNTNILRLGGRIGMGSHGNDEGIGAHNEIWALQMGGMTNLEALQTATISGAKALGLESDLGSISPGKIADLLILDENPLEDIHNTRKIKYVMKDGVLYLADTLETIWPFKRDAPEWKSKTVITNKTQ